MSRAFFKRFSTRSSEPASPISGWLKQDPQQLLSTAQRYLQLEQLIHAQLPTFMQGCRVAHIDRQTITLAVPSAAHATKLRQMIPSLLAKLNHSAVQFTHVNIQIQSVLFTGLEPLGQVRQGGAGIDETGLAAFEQLNQTLDQGPLATAVERLLNRHKQPKG